MNYLARYVLLTNKIQNSRIKEIKYCSVRFRLETESITVQMQYWHPVHWSLTLQLEMELWSHFQPEPATSWNLLFSGSLKRVFAREQIRRSAIDNVIIKLLPGTRGMIIPVKHLTVSDNQLAETCRYLPQPATNHALHARFDV